MGDNSGNHFTNLNHFEKFGFDDIKYDIDLNILEEKYIDLQREFHPDMVINKSAAEQIEAVNSSIALNEAYNILKNPLRRIEYILYLKASIVVNTEHDTIKADHEVLMEIMGLRESADDIKGDADRLENFTKTLKKKVNDSFSKAEKLLENNHFEEVAQLAIYIQYLQKIAKDSSIKL